jgi:hypothetical protein
MVLIMEIQKTVMDEKTLIKELQKELKQIFKPLFALTDVKAGDADSLSTLQKQLKLLPDEGAFGQLKQKYLPTIQAILDETMQEYKKHETSFLRKAKEKGSDIREVSQGWRVGSLLMETKPTEGKVRFCYNRVPLTPYIAVTGPASIEEAEKQALQMLEAAVIDQERLTQWMWIAYKKTVAAKHNQLEGQAVLIHEFAEEFLLMALKDKEYTKNIGMNGKSELPLWIFLYNLDRYRLLGGQIPFNQRIGLQTGSQQEVSKGLGLTVNGLFADQDYKTMCYVIQSK